MLSVTGVPYLVLQNEETYVEFPETVVGTSSDYYLYIENQGTGSLDFTSPAITDESFSIFWDDGLELENKSLAPGEIVAMHLSFSPQTEGSISASLTINSNDPNEGSLLLGLVGEALPPAVLAVNPDSYDFGTVIGGDTLVTEFDLANVGS